MTERAARRLAERFWAKVDRSGGPDACWPFTGRRTRKGYGSFTVAGRLASAHRVAYELTNGPIPKDLHALHTCDAPPCCNPAHIFLGTNLDNMRDRCSKGRQARGERTAKAKLTEANVVEIRARNAAGESQAALARSFGVSVGAIAGIVHRRNWRHVP